MGQITDVETILLIISAPSTWASCFARAFYTRRYEAMFTSTTFEEEVKISQVSH